MVLHCYQTWPGDSDYADIDIFRFVLITDSKPYGFYKYLLVKTLLVMSFLLSLLSACGSKREPIYEATHSDMTLKAYANTPSSLYPSTRYLVLNVNGMPDIHPQWGFVGQALPYRADVYDTAPVHYFDTTRTTMRLRPNMEPWDRQLRMLYLNQNLYSAAEFERIYTLLAHELPKLDSVLMNHPQETVRQLGQYKIAGVVYGTIADFTEVYTNGKDSLSILPDGSTTNMEWVSSNRIPTVQIAVSDTTKVDTTSLSTLQSTKTSRRLRDDFPIVIQQYDNKTSSFSSPVTWSVPAR